jgi:hypothetical protein
MKKFSLFFIALAAFVLLSPTATFACACCAEKGTYRIRTAKPTEYETELLKSMRFGNAAELFMTEAGFDIIKGLKSIEKDYDSMDFSRVEEFFSLTNSFAAKTWRFNFKTATGKTGALVLPMPAQMLSFTADIHDGETSGGGGPLLYKEWRFKGNVQSGVGFFGASIARPTTYFLVLQGRGNGCDNAEDFKNWRLEITGKNADYAFFGKMSDPQTQNARFKTID